MPFQPSFRQKLQYWFDNLMSAGAVSMIFVLVFFTISVILMSAAILTLGGALFAPPDEEKINFIEAIWISLMRTLDPGTMGQDRGWGFRILMLSLPTLGGVLIVSALIGIISNAITERIDELRRGRSIILEKNHTVILGWSPQVIPIITELIEAYANQKDAVVAILSTNDKTEMEDTIRIHIEESRTTRIICRSNDPMDSANLRLVGTDNARSIIILPAEMGSSDFDTLKIALAIVNDPLRKEGPYTIITSVADERMVPLLEMIGERDNLVIAHSNDIISKVISQTARQPGLSEVYTELLNFDGDEIYFDADHGLTNKTFEEARTAYTTSAVMGMVGAEGKILLNPPADTLIQPGSKIIAITFDDNTMHKTVGLFNRQLDASVFAEQQAVLPPTAEKTLLLGWNETGLALVHDLDQYVGPGSFVHVVTLSESCLAALNTIDKFRNIKVNGEVGDVTDRATLERLKLDEYDHIIVLANHTFTTQQSDARIMVCLLLLRDIARRRSVKFNIVSEMSDQRNRKLISAAQVDDFIVSDHLISLLISQLSENPGLEPIFRELFSSEGMEINLRPIENYIKLGVEVDFYQVIASAARFGQTAMGYRVRMETKNPELYYGIHLNPVKSEKVKFAAGDSVIVLSMD